MSPSGPSRACCPRVVFLRIDDSAESSGGWQSRCVGRRSDRRKHNVTVDGPGPHIPKNERSTNADGAVIPIRDRLCEARPATARLCSGSRFLRARFRKYRRTDVPSRNRDLDAAYSSTRIALSRTGQAKCTSIQ